MQASQPRKRGYGWDRAAGSAVSKARTGSDTACSPTTWSRSAPSHNRSTEVRIPGNRDRFLTMKPDVRPVTFSGRSNYKRHLKNL